MYKNIVPLVSFPKSGNTWVRFLLANLFKKDQSLSINFENINEFIPTTHDVDYSLLSELYVDDTPLFVKEHYNYHDMPYKYFEKAIYIYRDGFDSLNSYWHFTDAQSPGLFPNISSFTDCYWRYCGHWGEHLHSWIMNENINQKHKIFAVSYERLIEDPVSVLSEIASFLELDTDKARIKHAVQLSSKENMKKLSGSSEFMKSKKENFHFVRSGNQGDAKKELPEKCKVKFLENQMNYDLMKKFGYLQCENQWSTFKRRQETPLLDKIKYRYYRTRFNFVER